MDVDHHISDQRAVMDVTAREIDPKPIAGKMISHWQHGVSNHPITMPRLNDQSSFDPPHPVTILAAL